MFRKEHAKEDTREFARYKCNEAKYDPTTQTLEDFAKELKNFAKQAHGDKADQFIKLFQFGKLPVNIQQKLFKANKEVSSPEVIKFYRKHK